MNNKVTRFANSWVVWATLLPVAGLLIYRSLSPKQQKRFKKSFSQGTLTLAGTVLARFAEQYKNSRTLETSAVQDRHYVMSRIPNTDESETTIGDEKW